MESIYKRIWRVDFSDPLARRWFLLTVSRCSFPKAGSYRIILLAEQDVLGQAALEVRQQGE